MSDDANGLLEILSRHGAELHALLTRLTLRAGVAEDLLQELFLKLRSAEGFARASDRKAYAFRAAVNLACDWRRARRLTEPLRIEPPAAAEAPLDRMIDAEELEQVLDALPSLSELSRQVLVLRYLQHEDTAEIARQLDRTEHQVRGLCSRALAQLRDLLRPAHEKGGTRT